MIDEPQLDVLAYRLAGKLRLLLHLEDVRGRYSGYSQLFAEHKVLESYGYDMAACTHDGFRRRLRVVLWDRFDA